MPPNQGNPNYGAQITTRVPASVKSGTKKYGKQLHAADAIQNVNQSKVMRWALYKLYLDNWDDLPEDVRDDLDRDHLQAEYDQMPSLSEGSS